MAHTIPYLLPFLLPATIAVGYYRGGLAGYGLVFWIYILVPWVDSILGPARSFQFDDSRPPSPRVNRFCRGLLWLWVPAQTAMIFGTLVVVERHDLNPLQCCSIACALGLAGGVVGFTVVHELAHSVNRCEGALAMWLAALFTYPHFCIEHVRGHHFRVATPADPATARLGETLYAFFFRSVAGGLRNSWRLEAARLRASGCRSVSIHNRFLQGAAMVTGMISLIAIWFGLRGVAVFLAQSLVSVFLLEATNYVQHYGLIRREIAPGRYEPVSPLHAWNVEHRLTNWLLFNLGRHSEHHCESTRSYHRLSSEIIGPKLPLGLAGMVVISFFPPLFHWMMDPRVRYWRSVNQGNQFETLSKESLHV